MVIDDSHDQPPEGPADPEPHDEQKGWLDKVKAKVDDFKILCDRVNGHPIMKNPVVRIAKFLIVKAAERFVMKELGELFGDLGGLL